MTSGVIGRESEAAAAAAALDRLGTGAGGFLHIVGEPGIGKTHLLAAVRTMAVERGASVLSGRSAEFERDIPFQILLDALHERVDSVELTQLASGADLGDRLRLFQGLRRLLLTLAERPLVLLLDDVHWADPGSIDFLDYLSRHPVDAPLLVVVAHRDRQAPARLRYALARDSDHGTVTRIELGPLGRDAAAQLLRRLPGGGRVDEVYRESQGNPLYLLSLGQRTVSAAGGDGDVSSRLQALILGEIETLSADELAVAVTAAVVGDPFSADVLAEVAQLEEHEVRSALLGLADRDLVRAVPGGPRLMFRHPLVRRVVYDLSDPARRTAVHRRALERLSALGAPAVELARHIERSAAPWSPEHAELLLRAGHESMGTSPLTAAHWYRVAGELTPPDAAHDRERFEAGYLRARALCLGGGFAESRDLLHRLLGDARTGGAVNRSAAVVLCAHAEQRLGRYPEAIALLRLEIARLDAAGAPEDSAERVGLCLELGLTGLLANDYPAARPEITWALAAARRAGDVLGEATALAFSAFGEACVGHAPVAREAAAAAAALVDGLPDSALVDEREALSMLGWAELLLERFGAAERHLARGRAIIRRTGQSHGLPHVLLGQCLVSMSTGRMAEALERAEQAEDAAHLVGSDHLLGIALAVKAPILVWTSPLGSGGAAVDAARRASALFGAGPGDSWWERTALLLRGYAELANGDPKTCVDLLFKGGGEDLRLLGAPLLPEYFEILVGALLRLGDTARAGLYADRAVAFAEGLGLAGQSAHAARARGLVHARAGEFEAAAASFARAEAWFGEAGKAVEQAHTAVFAAPCLAALGRRDEALALVERAAAQAEAGGALWVRDELAKVREAAVGAQRAQRAASEKAGALAGLTGREAEVARLVGTGATNRQIASRLRLSERTVETHVANVYRKLGVQSRAALAGLLARTPGADES
jgi:DNA-binding CsgD family transcriptional regulator